MELGGLGSRLPLDYTSHKICTFTKMSNIWNAAPCLCNRDEVNYRLLCMLIISNWWWLDFEMRVKICFVHPIRWNEEVKKIYTYENIWNEHTTMNTINQTAANRVPNDPFKRFLIAIVVVLKIALVFVMVLVLSQEESARFERAHLTPHTHTHKPISMLHMHIQPMEWNVIHYRLLRI